MAQAQLNFVEADLDPTSDLYQLYDRLYQGMVQANEVDAPAFPSSDDFLIYDGEGKPQFDGEGNPLIDSDKVTQVEQDAASYSDILMKNSAYLFANAIMSVMNGGSSGSTTTGFVSRAGDSMKGALQAWYGFSAGSQGQRIFEVSINSSEEKLATVYGSLYVTENATVDGLLNLGDGVAFDGNTVMYYDNGTLTFENPTIDFIGDISVDGKITVGDVVIDENGISFGSLEFYHSGNSNKSDVDWTMKDANVYGNLVVKGTTQMADRFQALHGFDLGELGDIMLYSEKTTLLDDGGNPYDITWLNLSSDLKIVNNHGIKFGEDYVLNVRNADTVSFSAPGMTLNLGDSDNGKATDKISLQSGIWDYTNTFQLVSKEGAGFFPNGLMAKCAVSGSSVLETFRTDATNLGVVFPWQIRFGSTSGPAIFRDSDKLDFMLPYVNGEADGSPTENLNFTTYFAQTDSHYRNGLLAWSATLHFGTDGEFFCFDKPVESEYFAIKSDRYHTRLIEDALFFDDGKFIEGVTDGLRFAGNGYFDGDISSPSFASGFAGYGWAVKWDSNAGGYHATFDNLTVRKKMRLYQLEVQKISCTNGSLWVSDSCSGDEVIELV